MKFDVSAVIQRCNGMLAPAAYEAIYSAARSAPTQSFVEVGTAHAAGTVCLAMGLRDSGRTGKVYTFEKIIGGSREAFGSMDQNVQIIKSNLDYFGVSDLCELIIGDVSELASRVPSSERIGLLCLDADGAIDRDFRLFFSQVAEGAPIIIDDVQDMTRVKVVGRERLHAKCKVDLKHRLSYRLVELYQRKGYIDDGEIFGYGTWVGSRKNGNFEEVTADDVLSVYRSLTFTNASVSMIPMRDKLAATLGTVLPKNLLERLKSIETGDTRK